MSRVGLVIVAVAGLGAALAGCSGMGMSDMFSSQPATPPMESVQFESQPPGAEVRSDQGQTCLTPCALSIPAQSQAVTINKIGFVPQTIQITAGDPPEHSFWEGTPPPTLVPNPVQVVLQAVPPPAKPVHRRKPRQVSSRTRTAAKGAAPPPPGGSGNPFPDPPPQSGAPATEPAGDPGASPFPPPPAGGQQ